MFQILSELGKKEQLKKRSLPGRILASSFLGIKCIYPNSLLISVNIYVHMAKAVRYLYQNEFNRNPTHMNDHHAFL